MSREEQEQTRTVSKFIEDLVSIAPDPHDPRRSDNQGELDDLRAIASALTELRIEPPPGFREQLASRLPALAEQQSPRMRLRAFRASATTLVRARWDPVRSAAIALGSMAPTVTAAIAIALAVLVVRMIFDTGVASASEILSRSDDALKSLVRPGQLLYRRWEVQSTTTLIDGSKRVGPTRMIREWMDGNDPDRLAGRWYSEGDRLLVAYATVDNGGMRRPHVYFGPGVFGEPRGLLSVEPTPEEFGAAVGRFAEPIQGELHAYLHRHSIYMPIAGERAFNRAVIESTGLGESELARIVTTFDESTMADRTRVFRVRVVDPAWIDFNWRSEGPPRVRLARAETVRYIARDSYLSVRSEETLTFEDGRRRFTTRRLVEMRPVPIADLSPDPFLIDVPEGTPVQRQSAFDQLSGVAEAFSRLPEFARALSGPTHTH